MAAITISHPYAKLSRGRISAKHQKSGQWGTKSGSTVELDEPGKWMISATDGFSRKETFYVTVSDDMTVELPGKFYCN